MKQFFILFFSIFVLRSYAQQPPYSATYSSQFEMGDAKNAQAVLMSVPQTHTQFSFLSVLRNATHACILLSTFAKLFLRILFAAIKLSFDACSTVPSARYIVTESA